MSNLITRTTELAMTITLEYVSLINQKKHPPEIMWITKKRWKASAT